MNAADNLHAFPYLSSQVSSDRRAVLFFPKVEASSVLLPAPGAETPFGAAPDWPAAPRALVAPVLAGAAWWALTAEDALAVLAAESGAPADWESAETQEVSQA